MSTKDNILKRCREAITDRYEMPSLEDIHPVTYPDTLTKFKESCEAMGARVIDRQEGESLDDIIRSAYPDAETFCTNLPDITIVTSNPDAVDNPAALNGTDVGIIPGAFGVAENGCIWIEQTMRQRAVCFISENLVIVMPREATFNNMHEAYKHVTFNPMGYGVFISGPSKTADIAQVLVTGAQAARSVTVILT